MARNYVGKDRRTETPIYMSYLSGGDMASLEECVCTIIFRVTRDPSNSGGGDIRIALTFEGEASIPETDSKGVVVITQGEGERRSEITRIPLIEGFGFKAFAHTILFKVAQVFVATGRFDSYDIVTSYHEGYLILSSK